MQQYKFQHAVLAADHPHWQAALSNARVAKQRPLCLCRRGDDAVPMYVARINEHSVLKRMPFTGSKHAPACDHYEPPPELSGYGQVNGAAIRDDTATDTTTLTLDFSLTKGASRATAVAGDVEHESVRADGTKLTLRATLHYLYDQAHLTRWSPRMLGKRSWFVVRRELLEAASGKKTKGLDLADALFVPEQFSSNHVADINQRRVRSLMRLSTSAANRMILIAPLKELQPSRFGYRMLLKHMPDMPLKVDEDLHKRITTRFAWQLGAWELLESTHILVIGTFSQPQPGLYNLESACLANVDEHWLPFDGMHEQQLVDALVRQGRKFTKGLRYNLTSNKPLASAVLQDTHTPVALFVVPADADETYKAALQQLISESDMDAWCWSAGEDAMPELPPAMPAVSPAAMQ